MNHDGIATLIRSVAGALSRRDILRGLAGIGIGLSATRLPETAAAKKREKKLHVNAFGCVPIGKPCRGSNANCCSGVCQGKKPQKGKKDKSHCVAHDASTCNAGERIEDVCGGAMDVDCTTRSGDTGTCNATTGNAPYCAREASCRTCSRDADCRPFCGENAACIVCMGCTAAGGTACAGPEEGSCQFPM